MGNDCVADRMEAEEKEDHGADSRRRAQQTAQAVMLRKRASKKATKEADLAAKSNRTDEEWTAMYKGKNTNALTYCSHEDKKTENVDPRVVYGPRRQARLSSTCANCGRKKSTFLKTSSLSGGRIEMPTEEHEVFY